MSKWKCAWVTVLRQDGWGFEVQPDVLHSLGHITSCALIRPDYLPVSIHHYANAPSKTGHIDQHLISGSHLTTIDSPRTSDDLH